MQKRIESIRLLRFPLAVFVVMEHTLPHYINSDIKPITYLLFDTLLRGNNVPVFFFISGFLLFNTDVWNSNVWLGKIKRRIHTLFIPYLIWNIYAILILWIVIKGMHIMHIEDGYVFTPSLQNIVNCFWTYDGSLSGVPALPMFPINVATWYIRDLMLLCLASLLIYRALKKAAVPTLVIIAAAWLFTNLYATTSLFFFTFGAYFGIHRKTLPVLSGRTAAACLVLYILSAAVAWLNPELLEHDAFLYIKKINIITFLFVAFYASAHIKAPRHATFLSGASVFLFLAHQPVCGKIDKFIIHVLKPHDEIRLTAINLLSVTITVVSILVIYRLLQRYAPRTLQFLTGKNRA